MTYKVQIDNEIRNATRDEIVVIEHGQAETAAKVAAIEAIAVAKASARTKLKTLGLTDEEIAALVG